MRLPEQEGPPEPVALNCPYCRKPVQTLWAPGGHGLLPGPYELLGDQAFHQECAEKICEEMSR